MPRPANPQLFIMIFEKSINKPLQKITYYEIPGITDNYEKKLQHWLRGASTNFFEIVQSSFSCFTLAIFLRNQIMLKKMLSYAKEKNIALDFSKPAFGRKADCDMNVLQFAFRYGNPDAFRACCDFINDEDKIKKLMNKIIERKLEGRNGEMEIHYSTIWEESLFSIALPRMVYDLRLNNEKYDTQTIKFLGEYFTAWRAFSILHSVGSINRIQDEWKIYAEKYNNANPSKKPLSLENDLLNDPIEFMLDPFLQFNYAIENEMIDIKAMGSSDANIIQILELLSTDPKDKDNIRNWEKSFLGLISAYQDEINPVATGEIGEDLGLRSMLATFNSNMINGENTDNKMEPIQAKLIFSFNLIKQELLKKIEEQKQSVNVQVQESVRRHSRVIKELNESINKMVEGKRQGYEKKFDALYNDDKDKNILVKNFFSDLCNRTIIHATARQIAADGLFKVNPTTAAAKRAIILGTAFKVVAEAMPIQVTVIPAIINIGISYITAQHAAKQSEGVSATASQVNLPLLLTDLSATITEMVMLVGNLSPSEQNTLKDKIIKGINSKLDDLHSHEEKPNEEELRELLLVSATEAVKDYFIKSSKREPLRFQQRSGSGSSSGSNKTGSTLGTKSSKGTESSRKSGPGCAIS